MRNAQLIKPYSTITTQFSGSSKPLVEISSPKTTDAFALRKEIRKIKEEKTLVIQTEAVVASNVLAQQAFPANPEESLPPVPYYQLFLAAHAELKSSGNLYLDQLVDNLNITPKDLSPFKLNLFHKMIPALKCSPPFLLEALFIPDLSNLALVAFATLVLTTPVTSLAFEGKNAYRNQVFYACFKPLKELGLLSIGVSENGNFVVSTTPKGEELYQELLKTDPEKLQAIPDELLTSLEKAENSKERTTNEFRKLLEARLKELKTSSTQADPLEDWLNDINSSKKITADNFETMMTEVDERSKLNK